MALARNGLADSLRWQARRCVNTLGTRLLQAWEWHCHRFDNDMRYRLVVLALADLLARRLEPVQLLRWLQRLIIQRLLDADPDI